MHYPSAASAKPDRPGIPARVRDGVAAGVVAGALSGVPSTLHAWLTGRDPLDAARAAGNLVLPAGAPPRHLLAGGVLVHAALSLGWGTVLAMVLPRPRAVAWGALAGLGIAALDLGIVARFDRRLKLIRALPALPQVADHVVFGALSGAVLSSRRHGHG